MKRSEVQFFSPAPVKRKLGFTLFEVKFKFWQDVCGFEGRRVL
jgi:hypothetical protein